MEGPGPLDVVAESTLRASCNKELHGEAIGGPATSISKII